MTIGVFIARGKEDALVTKNIVPGETVYGEKKISVDAPVRYAFFYILFSSFSNEHFYKQFSQIWENWSMLSKGCWFH